MEFVYSTTLTEDSDEVTLAKTNKLVAGLNCYNVNLPMKTKILTVVDTTTLKLTQNALADYVGTIIYTDLEPSKYAEKKQALKDVQCIVKCNGQYIEYILRDETQVTRGAYSSIKSKTQDIKVLLKAFPITYSASKEFLEKVGLKEDCNIVIHTAMQDWIDEGYGYEDIETIRSTIKLNGISYKISEKTLADYIGNNGCYVVFGIKL